MKVWASKTLSHRKILILFQTLCCHAVALFAIRLALTSTFLRFVIQSNETGHGVKDRAVDRSGRLDGSAEAFRKNTNMI